MLPIPLELFCLLIVISLVAGIGCTTTGAGGILVTISLYVFTSLSSAEIAGTAHIVFIAVGIVGAIGFTRSGELLGTDGRALAAILSGTSILGALTGAYVNAYISHQLFSILLGTLTVIIGSVLFYGQIRDLPAVVTVDVSVTSGRLAFSGVGLFLGLTSGIVGIGGPILAVPVLVTLGVPLLLSLGVAQVQAIFISGFAASGYVLQDAISPFFATLTTVPAIIGAVSGWVLAHHVDPDHLELVLSIVLLPLGLYLLT
ncbi:sulfite exporter TauE/SafE family protein [Halopiger aswanensis]|uniref:Probable membrane transporter protein n=1 Tax=Halopiger aswanensis TaxID=148449 RepID=A0A3R7HW16_9EURY|nr:sulfite exporter TauE/SafE family protein [Halopiger aswanensis]RKD89291.1 hypothetical protein ATJ93_4124 [Halopiger aswanensis]